MHVDIGCRLEGVIDVDDARVGADRAGVADLAARFAVERRAVQDDLDRLAGLRLLDRPVRPDEPQNPRLRLGLRVAQELRRPSGKPDVDLGPRARPVPESVAGPAAADRPLLGQRLLEPGLVDFQTLFAGQLDRQVEGEAVGVVEPEDLAPRQRVGDRLAPLRGLFRQILDQRLEPGHPRAEGAPEALLLVREHLFDLGSSIASIRGDDGRTGR